MNNYLSLVKFSHTVFAMPFALIGFTIAITRPESHFELLLLFKVILCMIFARTAAMAFNRYIDRNIDAQNSRTAVREIPKGVVSPVAALTLVILSSVAFIITTYTINQICFYLSPVALIVVLGYSLTKRFTWLCHLILGIGLSLAPIGAYLAVTGKFDWLPLLFSFTVITWVSGFDIIYALQDEEFDRNLQLNSMPVAFGKKGALNISILLHLLSVAFVFVAGLYLPFGIIYWIGFSVFAILITYQHIIVKPNDLSRVNLAFFTTNGIASIVFSAFVIADLLR
ncbi:MAG: UbiA family prenyltransferase [Bacteroidetes bacterium]|nr:UbiA family prenyltransferase [Bacteroidota bacterium]MBP6427473.1 putative 4-hydroxybenzoate polyprenyltransferase [Bacteroidia bacterium]MBK8364074.1 UbiA family prenyltransferase [Bacteroidota bacterium]MBK9413432.1 UbiA family prenyltransferase [Bacteroidota bacterium]MBL0032590.1 UbiA family prenyltransferase [Bacteroidota bacterium]